MIRFDPATVQVDPPEPMFGGSRACGPSAFGVECRGLKAPDQPNTWSKSECRDRRPAADFTSAPRPPLRRLMNTSPHDFVTVDMRGLKAALVACAAQRRASVSAVVRAAVGRELGLEGEGGSEPLNAGSGVAEGGAWTKLSIRMSRSEADRLDAGARAAGLSRGAYLAALVDRVPVLLAGGRPEHIAALTASCAELSTLSRNVHQLTSLLRAGDVEQALVYRDMLDCLSDDVRRHLRQAAQALADLRPGRGSNVPARAVPSARRRR